MRIEENDATLAVTQAPAAQMQTATSSNPSSQMDQVDVHPLTTGGIVSLNGIAAYFEVRQGEKLVYKLVEESSGRVLREISPDEMMRISGAIDEMLNHKAEDK